MSGVTGWILGYLDEMTQGKWTFRTSTFWSYTFASGHWNGIGVDVTATGYYPRLSGIEVSFSEVIGIDQSFRRVVGSGAHEKQLTGAE